jgi:hypothetical protein
MLPVLVIIGGTTLFFATVQIDSPTESVVKSKVGR